MIKTEYLKFRATRDEAKEIERIAKTLGLSRSDYLRAVAFGAPAPRGSPQTPAETAPTPDLAPLQADIEILKTQQKETAQALTQSAESFTALLGQLNQLLRVPSFREYRARALAEEPAPRPGENEMTYLLRLAHEYHMQYQIWPNPTDTQRNGKFPEGFPRAKP